MFDKPVEITLFGQTFELWIFNEPVGIAVVVATVVALLMAALALTVPRLYQRLFVPLLWFAFAVAVGGSAYCWGMSAGIVEAFDVSRDLDVALTIHDMAAEWRLRSLWFSLGFLGFCVLHIAFGYIARWIWLRRKRADGVAPDPLERDITPSAFEQPPREER
jgi:hypothetical protein